MTILKFVRQCTSILATQVDAPALFLFTAQIASKCGPEFADLAYDFYVQTFSVCEHSISESCAQLAAITIIIGTLQSSQLCLSADAYDTLITKAALHGAKLLKKPHQYMWAVISAGRSRLQRAMAMTHGRTTKRASLPPTERPARGYLSFLL
ncbi:vacuolar protein sorting-associated protein 35-domain-containing protein [Pisolithus albus]|nr:vacuolar protein sorting-associated protein 35-domain-containing protein [Pisolithus albus]